MLKDFQTGLIPRDKTLNPEVKGAGNWGKYCHVATLE